MSEQTRNDIRRLLKMFGIQADEAMIAHIAKNPGGGPLQVRVTLEDLTDYGEDAPAEPLRVVIEGSIQR